MKYLDCIVIGGGISGLSAAFFLKKKGQNVLLLEKSDRVGGVMHSIVKDGFLLEEGPNTMMGMNAAVKEIVQACGLKPLTPSKGSKNRFIYKSGKLHGLPMNPLSLLTSPLLSASAKLQIAKEPWILTSVNDETIQEFFERRFGKEVTDTFVDPFVSGIYAGDIQKLSMAACFPKLLEGEKQYGSVIRAILKQKNKGSKPERTLYSFREGLEELPRAMEKWLGESVVMNSIVRKVTIGDSHQVTVTVMKNEAEYQCNRLILATPAYVSAELLQHVDSDLAKELLLIPYAPLSIFYFGFQKKDVGHPLDGFGYLIPRSEGLQILGTLFSSSLFPNRAPEGQVLLTVMASGAETSLKDVLTELKQMLAITAHPIFAHSHHYMKAIPQYVMGHTQRMERIQLLEKKNTGLALIGNYLTGVSTTACVEAAFTLSLTNS